MSRALLALSALVVLLLLASVSAFGLDIPANDLLRVQPHLGWRTVRPGQLGHGWDARAPFIHPEDPELLALEVIRDENWINLLHVQASREALIPLASANLYIVHAVRVSQLKKSKVQEVPPDEFEPSRWDLRVYAPSDADVRAYAPDFWNLRAKAPDLQKVPAKSSSQEPVSGWRPLRWLFEEEGLFSGQSWNWDNFLPRLLTVAGLVLGGLLAVEVLHAIVQMGGRAFIEKSRQKKR